MTNMKPQPGLKLHQILIRDPHTTEEELSSIVAENICSFRKQYPGGEHRIWDENALRSMIASHFSDAVVDSFDKLKPYAYKADLGRYCLLYIYGGIYADLSLRFLNPVYPEPNIGLFAFRDLDLAAASWTTCQNTFIWAKPGRREFRIAIDYIVENCRNMYYGANPLYPTGPVLFGRSIAMAMAENGQQANADDQWIGITRALTQGQTKNNYCYLTPDYTLIAVSTKWIGGDLHHIGLSGTNNYNAFWHGRRVYGETIRVWMFDDPDIKITPLAERTATGIAAKPGAIGRLTYGPYHDLEPGHYLLCVKFTRANSLPRMLIDVVQEWGSKVVHIHEHPSDATCPDNVIEIAFFCAEPLRAFEFRVETFEIQNSEIESFSLEKIGV